MLAEFLHFTTIQNVLKPEFYLFPEKDKPDLFCVFKAWSLSIYKDKLSNNIMRDSKTGTNNFLCLRDGKGKDLKGILGGYLRAVWERIWGL